MFKLMILNAMKYMSVRTYVFCAFILAAALLAPQNNTHATKNGADEDSTATAASRINRYLNLLATTADEFDSRREDASLEQTIVSDLCHYFLSLQGGHKLQADKALEHAFQSNVKRSESIYKGRTFAKLLLFFSIDRPGSEVAAFMKRWDPKDIDPSLDLYYAEMAQYEVIPFTDEWIKRKVVEFTKPKADTGELAIGRLIDMLVQLHADIDAKIENSDGSDETRIAIVNKIQTSLWLESTILSSHTSLFLAGRFWDPAPYPYLKSAITTLCKHSSPEGQTRLIELTSAVAQQELNLRRLKGALSLYQLSSILVKAASPQLPRWHYYDVKFRLQVTHIRTLLSQVDVTLVLLEGTEKDLDQIKDKSDRLEMYGFFHRYRGQLYILASRYEQAADDMEKSARAFEQIHHHNAIGSWASLAEAWRGQKEYKKVEEAIRNGLAARDALTGKIPERVLNNECVSLYLAEAQLAWDLKQYSRLRKILNQYQPGVRDVNVRSLMQVLNGVCYLEYEQDYAAAMDSLKDAWAIIGKFKNQNALIVARYLGRCNRELGQVGESVRWFQQALLIDEELRRSARGSLAYWAHLVRLEFDEMTDELFAAAWDQSQINPSSKTEMYRK
ncbi:MAG: hypothetical protein KAV87_25055, partial [Desulfobacteraceae bacterium]|nr:hypothetical protein [Desulfobacteraceae bacterium]